MIKRFSISLFVIATTVYGTILYMSFKYGTGFFDEVMIQMNRLNITMSKGTEPKYSKFIMETIIKNDHPPDIWKNMITHTALKSHEELFYFYKVWTIKTNLTLENVADSYPILKKRKEKVTLLNVRFGKDKPVVQFPFFTTEKGHLIAGLFFPINEKPISADLNHDKALNFDDVLIARKSQ